MSNKLKLILLLVSLALLPVIYFAASTTTNLFSQASEEFKTYTVDPQTGEFYDLYITAYPFKPIIENNISYKANVGFQINGDRIAGRQTLYGAVQKYNSNEYQQTFNFSSEGNGVSKIFKSELLTLLDNPSTGCIDLHYDASRTKDNYIATFCYGLSFFSTKGTSARVYSVSGNPFFETTFNGTKPASIITLTTGFNKYTSNNGPYYTGGNQKGTRVNYFSQDDNTNARDFTNATYTIQGLTQGLSEAQRNQICTINNTFPPKYLRYSRSMWYEGGDLLELTQHGLGGCSYEIQQPTILGGWMSLWSNNIFPAAISATPPKVNNISPSVAQLSPTKPTSVTLCIPKPISPGANSNVTSNLLFSWQRCNWWYYIQVRVNGEGINWQSEPMRSSRISLTGLTLKPGGTYSWSVRSCTTRSCSVASGWSNSNTFTYKKTNTIPTPTKPIPTTPTKIVTKVITPTQKPTAAPTQKSWSILLNTICPNGTKPITPYNTYWYTWDSENSTNAGVTNSTTLKGLSNKTYYISLSDKFGPLKPKTIQSNMNINTIENNVSWNGNLNNGSYTLVFEARSSACK